MKPETQYKLLVKVASADRAAGILARIAGAQQVKTAVDKSTLINAGAGLGGAALGAGAGYALSGLSPAMKKKKLYRILAALGGGAAGGAAGYFGAGAAQDALAKRKAQKAFAASPDGKILQTPAAMQNRITGGPGSEGYTVYGPNGPQWYPDAETALLEGGLDPSAVTGRGVVIPGSKNVPAGMRRMPHN